MIEVRGVTKTFDGYTALRQMDMTIRESSVFGLIGTNGAGKSTFLRMAAGILKPDEGEIRIDGEPVFENPSAKQKCFFISDDAYFFPNATPADMGTFYTQYYPAFDGALFQTLLETFGLQGKRKLRTFSKGMKKQFFIAAGLAANTKYLFCDETFDGLDPVMRQAAKSLFAKAMTDRGLTVVLASHNLRELEDICDYVGVLYQGGVLLSRDLDNMKQSIQKVQFVLPDGAASEPSLTLAALHTPEQTQSNDAAASASAQTSADEVPGQTGSADSSDAPTPWGTPLPAGLELVRHERHGRLHTVLVRGSRETAEWYFGSLDPLYFEMIPLSLEEIFISETEAAGYDIKNLLA